MTTSIARTEIPITALAGGLEVGRLATRRLTPAGADVAAARLGGDRYGTRTLLMTRRRRA
jgi:hypothetical protein